MKTWREHYGALQFCISLLLESTPNVSYIYTHTYIYNMLITAQNAQLCIKNKKIVIHDENNPKRKSVINWNKTQ